jgi:peptidoglycan/LPS O-acetylase OafA/YrhL
MQTRIADSSSAFLTPSQTPKTYMLTSVRFFLATLVVFHHTVGTFLPWMPSVDPHHMPHNFGARLLFSLNFPVSFFFLLSGYVLSLAYLRGGRIIDKGRFFWTRFARLYPLYFVMLLLCLPQALIGKMQQHGSAEGIRVTAVALAAQLVFLQGWAPYRLLVMDPPTWSLSSEMLFYALFPIFGTLLWTLRGMRLWLVALGIYVCGLMLVWLATPHMSENTGDFWPPLHMATFALGILLARGQTLVKEHSGTAIRAWQANVPLLCAAASLVLTAWLLGHLSIANLVNHGLLSPAYAAIIWALSDRQTQWSKLLSANWMVQLGNASYGIYLVHIPLEEVFVYCHATQPLLYPLYMAAVIGLSLLSFRYFETPVRIWLTEQMQARLAMVSSVV